MSKHYTIECLERGAQCPGKWRPGRFILSTRTLSTRHARPLWWFPVAGGDYFSLLDHELAFAGWTQSRRIGDDGLHGRVDDSRLAEWAGEWMLEEL